MLISGNLILTLRAGITNTGESYDRAIATNSTKQMGYHCCIVMALAPPSAGGTTPSLPHPQPIHVLQIKLSCALEYS